MPAVSTLQSSLKDSLLEAPGPSTESDVESKDLKAEVKSVSIQQSSPQDHDIVGGPILLDHLRNAPGPALGSFTHRFLQDCGLNRLRDMDNTSASVQTRSESPLGTNTRGLLSQSQYQQNTATLVTSPGERSYRTLASISDTGSPARLHDGSSDFFGNTNGNAGSLDKQTLAVESLLNLVDLLDLDLQLEDPRNLLSRSRSSMEESSAMAQTDSYSTGENGSMNPVTAIMQSICSAFCLFFSCCNLFSSSSETNGRSQYTTTSQETVLGTVSNLREPLLSPRTNSNELQSISRTRSNQLAGQQQQQSNQISSFISKFLLCGTVNTSIGKSPICRRVGSFLKNLIHALRWGFCENPHSEDTKDASNKGKDAKDWELKCDPKTLLSNERTFFRYLHQSSLLATVSVFLVRSPNFARDHTTRLAGFLIGLVAVLLVIWSYLLFELRLNLLKATGRIGTQQINHRPYGVTVLFAPEGIVLSLVFGFFTCWAMSFRIL